MGRERQRQKNEETRQAILEASVKIAMEQGFDALSIRKITNALGYSAGIIYYYFKDKQEIIDTIHLESSFLMSANIQKIFNMERGFEYNTRIVFHMIMELALDQPEKYNLIVLDKYSKRGESIDKWIDIIAQSILVGIASGELRQMDSKMAAFNVWSAFIGLMIMISGNKEITKVYAEKVFNNHLDIIMNGMKKEERGEKK